jgi:hypothetical protein
MSIRDPNKLPVNTRFAGFGVIALLIMMLAGCANNYGGFANSAEVNQAFRQGDTQPGYQYYYTGRDNMPYAIVGIDRSYTVPSKYWIAFEPDSETLRKMSGNMYGKHKYYPVGAHILDPEGTIIGVWYSSIRNYSVSVDPENQTVKLLYRNPENTRDMSVSFGSRHY